VRLGRSGCSFQFGRSSSLLIGDGAIAFAGIEGSALSEESLARHLVDFQAYAVGILE
jgi:hypothetical protein